MKKAHILFTGILLFVSVFSLQASEKDVDFFLGKWKVLVEGTPSGDSYMIINLELNEKGEVVGTTTDESGNATPTKFTRVETSDESVTAYWVAQGYDVYLFLEKIDENKVEGSLMDMFDATGTRLTKE
jgi:hypothetical protein